MTRIRYWLHCLMRPRRCVWHVFDLEPGWEQRRCRICGCVEGRVFVDNKKQWAETEPPTKYPREKKNE